MMSEIKNITIIGGCGHVGLPLGIALASRGFSVSLLDIDHNAIQKINSGKMPFLEEGGEEHLKKALAEGCLRATNDAGTLSECHAAVFVTGTPVDEHLNPRVHDVMRVVEMYLPYLADKLVLMRSTVYPGVVELVDNRLKEKFGKSLLAFCPERIVQGKGIEEIHSLPQIIAATSPEAEKMAASIFSRLTKKLLFMKPIEAELAKLITNSWRYLEFAIANQFYMMVESRGLDFWRVLQGVKEDYPRAAHYPRPGLAAGPCLFKDTMQLASFHNNNFFLGHTGMLVNEGLPAFLIQQLEQKLGSLAGKDVAILGMTFKPNNDDTRESLSFKLKKLLEMKMANVLPSDPYLQDSYSLSEALERADGVILGVPHREYAGLKIDKPLVDCWGSYAKVNLSQSPFSDLAQQVGAN